METPSKENPDQVRKKNKRKKRIKKKKKNPKDQSAESAGLPAAKTDTTSPVPDTKSEEQEGKKTHKASSSVSSKNKMMDNRKGKKKRKLSHDQGDVREDRAIATPGEQPRHPFQVDDTDHCETPSQAYQHVLDILDQLAKSINKKRSNLRIYDPYYCDGGVKKKLAVFGFASVINQNRDFYDDVEKKNTPGYDVLVTNPPYSGVHMEKILAFCSLESSTKQKPFLLLLPHFVYTKDYYQRSLSPNVSSSMFFLVPEVRYSYLPPAWVEANKGSKAIEQGKNVTAPFPSFWYCHAPKKMVSPNWLTEKFGPSGMIRSKHHSKLRYAKISKDLPRDFKGEFDSSKKRANPRARKRAAKKRREEAMRRIGGGGR